MGRVNGGDGFNWVTELSDLPARSFAAAAAKFEAADSKAEHAGAMVRVACGTSHVVVCCMLYMSSGAQRGYQLLRVVRSRLSHLNDDLAVLLALPRL